MGKLVLAMGCMALCLAACQKTNIGPSVTGDSRIPVKHVIEYDFRGCSSDNFFYTDSSGFRVYAGSGGSFTFTKVGHGKASITGVSSINSQFMSIMDNGLTVSQYCGIGNPHANDTIRVDYQF